MTLSERATQTESPEVVPDDWVPLHPLDTAEEDGGWLPIFEQMRTATVQQIELAVGPDAAGVPFHRGLHSSMRQAFGMVGMVALLATFPATIASWLGIGVTARFAPFAGVAEVLTGNWGRMAELALFGMDEATLENSIAGAPWLWTLGAWLGAPMRFWTIWLVGGLLVFAIARMIGASNTLPRFFAATGYAFLPLLLLVLLPIPVFGVVALVAALILFILAYAQGVQVATQMEWGHVLIAMGLPIALLAILFVVFPALLLLFL